jgi:hypothetical protein
MPTDCTMHIPTMCDVVLSVGGTSSAQLFEPAVYAKIHHAKTNRCVVGGPEVYIYEDISRSVYSEVYRCEKGCAMCELDWLLSVFHIAWFMYSLIHCLSFCLSRPHSNSVPPVRRKKDM